MGNVVVGGMSDVLRIQMERAGLEDNLASLLSARLTVQARFNALLNRPSDASVCVPDSLTQRFYRIDGQLLLDSIFTRNPMLAMLEAEGEAYRAKAKMDRRMSYPMIGIGLQYSVVTRVSRSNPVKQVRLYGKIIPDERSLQSQTAYVGGRIERLDIEFTGETVRAGQTLATLYSPELFTAQQELLEAVRMQQPALVQAAREKLRLWNLTDAQIDAIQYSGQASPMVEIKSNTNGIVIAKRVNRGDYVSQGSILFDIANLSRVWAMFDAFEVDLPFLAKDRIVVPQTAVLWTGKRAVVYVRLPDTDTPTFRMREVTLGPALGGAYVVLDGLSDGEEIVTNGVFSIDASAQLEGKRSMMNEDTPGTAPMTGHQGHSMSGMSGSHAVSQESEHVLFAVRGSCDMCKERIETAAKGVSGVRSAHWDQEKQMIHLQLDPSETSADAVAKAAGQWILLSERIRQEYNRTGDGSQPSVYREGAHRTGGPVALSLFCPRQQGAAGTSQPNRRTCVADGTCRKCRGAGRVFPPDTGEQADGNENSRCPACGVATSGQHIRALPLTHAALPDIP